MKSINNILSSYSEYKESSFSHRMFKHADILPLLKSLKSKDVCSVEEIGESLEGRSIHVVKYGLGSRTRFF